MFCSIFLNGGRIPRKSGFLHCLIAVVLALHVLFSSGSAEAGEGAPAMSAISAPQPLPEKNATPEESPPAKIFINDDTPTVNMDVDNVHERLEQGILGQVVNLDNFFGNPLIEDEGKTGYHLQVRNFIRVGKGGNLSGGAALRANVTLSRISERLRLYISGDNEPEPIAPRLPEDPGNPGFDRTGLTAKVVNTELRYGLFQTRATNMFLGAGVTLTIPAEAFVRSRIQHTHHFNNLTHIRLGETVFMNNTVTLGETTEISLERILNRKNILRWDSTGTVARGSAGLEWGTELSLLHVLSSKSAITLTGGVYGNTTIDDMITDYRLLSRYRQNFLRSWLFYELVPELSWPRQADGLFPANYAISFILEVSFKGNTSGKENKQAQP